MSKIFLVKAYVENGIIEPTGKEVELDAELEEKMFKELREKFYDIDYFTFKQTIQKLKEELK